MKNLALFNLSLLGKWRCRLLVDKEALWCKVLKAKYGEVVCLNPDFSHVRRCSLSSVWWKDLSLIVIGLGGEEEWLVDGVGKKKSGMVKLSDFGKIGG